MHRHPNPQRTLLICATLLLSLLLPLTLHAQETDPDDPLDQISLDDFLQSKVTTASRNSESILNTPATIVVVSRQEILQRGYNDLTEVLHDLPGFDLSLTAGTQYLMAYQRGYRTPFTQRTLLMVDGNVDNHLWSHQANISRQYPLSNIQRIEVLYGPVSAVYGPNAFLGVINIITTQSKTLKTGEISSDVRLLAGSWNSRSVDANLRSKVTDDLSLSLTGRFFQSDEADLSGEWGWLDNKHFSNTNTWGPMIPNGQPGDPNYSAGISNNDQPLGSYNNPSRNYALHAKLNYKDLEIGVLHWQRKEAYGPYYAADKAQNNNFWTYESLQVYANHTATLSPKLSITSSFRWRNSNTLGDWSEASPDGENPEFSYISFSTWHSDNSSFLFKEQFNAEITDWFTLSGGLKYELRNLTKAYDIPGYWDAFSSVPTSDGGPEGFGTSIHHSDRSNGATFTPGVTPNPNMPDRNRVFVDDIGGYLLSVLDWQALRFNGGLRYDVNSIYGDTFNPRAALIYRYGEHLDNIDGAAVKLLYGTAFQEPAAIQLYGGWQGRNANPNLQPERVSNIELNHLLLLGPLLTDVSAYLALYDDVITEVAENTGQRRIFGVEAKMRLNVPNLIPRSDNIQLYAYYTFTQSQSDRIWDFDEGAWVPATEDGGWAELGDIAPHKVHAGLNIPILSGGNFNFSTRWISERRLYLANALRNPNRPTGERTLDGYILFDLFASVDIGPATLGLKIKDLLDTDYLNPGPEGANSGDSFSDTRSGGFFNSAVPTPGRSIWGTLRIALD